MEDCESCLKDLSLDKHAAAVQQSDIASAIEIASGLGQKDVAKTRAQLLLLLEHYDLCVFCVSKKCARFMYPSLSIYICIYLGVMPQCRVHAVAYLRYPRASVLYLAACR